MQIKSVYLFGDEEHDALKELVAVERRDGEVEEESIQDGTGDELEPVDELDGQADEDVRKNARHSRLPHAHDPSGGVST